MYGEVKIINWVKVMGCCLWFIDADAVKGELRGVLKVLALKW